MYLPFHPCRRIGTDAAKQWLCKLKEEEVPVLVCLTHADRLYADLIPKDKSETLEPTGFKQQQIGRELQVCQMKYCFCGYCAYNTACLQIIHSN